MELLKEKLLVFHPRTSLSFISNGCVVNLAYENITRISGYGDQVIVYTAVERYRTARSLQDLYVDLPVNLFFRVHISHIVSLKSISAVEKTRIIVGEQVVPMTAYYKFQLIKRLGEILDQGYRNIISTHEPTSAQVIPGYAAGAGRLQAQRTRQTL